MGLRSFTTSENPSGLVGGCGSEWGLKDFLYTALAGSTEEGWEVLAKLRVFPFGWPQAGGPAGFKSPGMPLKVTSALLAPVEPAP